MKTSILIPYHIMEDTSNLRNCLRTLYRQTVKPHQVIVIDDSVDALAVQRLCQEFDVDYITLPYRQGLPQWGRKYNEAIQAVTGDTVMLLCANWLCARYMLEYMQMALTRLGEKAIVVSDSQRQQMDDAQGLPVDWFQNTANQFVGQVEYPIPYLDGKAMMFETQNHNLIDMGYLLLMRTQDWIPWDEEFDKVGAWHSVIEWGWRLLNKHDMHLWILRGLLAWHQPAGFNFIPGKWLTQTKESQRMLATKIPNQPAE